MVKIESEYDGRIELPDEVGEVLKENDFHVIGFAAPGEEKGKSFFTTIQYQNGVWIKVYKNGFGRPEWLLYFPPGYEREATIHLRIRKLYKPLT